MIEPSLLHAYVDHELTDFQRQEVDARLANCAASQKELAAIKALKAGVGSKVSSAHCDATWAKCQDRLNTIDRVERSGNFITRYSWGFVTAVAAIVIVGGGMSRNAQQGTMSGNNLSGIINNKSVTPMQKMQNEQIDRLLKNADRRLYEFKVLGARQSFSEGRNVFEYSLRDSDGPLSMVIIDGITKLENMNPLSGTRYTSGSINLRNIGNEQAKQNCISWQMDGKTVILMGQRSQQSLAKAADLNFRAQ
jgi:hypothetical protein